MPPTSHGFIIESMLSESFICLKLLFKGSLSTCVVHSSELDFACRPYPQFVSESHDSVVLSCTLALLSSLVGNLERNSRHFIIGR
jgi:hypothetical protein